MRHILTFKTSFPETSEILHPKGYSICEFLEREVSKANLQVKSKENYRDIAWSLDCVINGKNIFFFVGYLGTKFTDWQLIICSTIGIVGRILGKNDEDEKIKLAETIHTIIKNDERFTDIKWHEKYTDKPTDKWYNSPID